MDCSPIIAAETRNPDELSHRCITAAGQSISPPILGVAVVALLVLAQIATSVYLARRAA